MHSLCAEKNKFKTEILKKKFDCLNCFEFNLRAKILAKHFGRVLVASTGWKIQLRYSYVHQSEIKL